jgi:hypothetical protein
MQPSVLLCGSRSLPESAAPFVARVACAVAASRVPVVGCASGADLFALRALLWCRSLSVFAVGSPSGAGFWRCSAPLSALRAAPSVRWLAGGPLSVPLSARLRARSLAAVASLPCVPGSGAVAFLASPSSPGSLLSLRAAAAAGLPAVVFPVGFSPALLSPLFRSGAWVPAASSGLWARALRWV